MHVFVCDMSINVYVCLERHVRLERNSISINYRGI